jgi:NADH-quinone oxidoreductase subunit D
VVTEEESRNWGFSGVMVRGSGLAWDLRRAQPYECYDEFDFQIPVGKNGDCYDRYLCRMEEMRESAQDHPPGDREAARAGGRATCWRAARSRPPSRGDMKTSMEALIHHFKLYTEGLPRARGRGLCRRRGAQGRVRRLPRGRWHQPALPRQAARAGLPAPAGDGSRGQGHQLADVAAIIGTMDVVFGEIDR